MSRRYRLALARISHQASTAATDPGMSTALRSLGLLDVLLSTPAGPLGRAPCIHARLRRLATRPGEKSGLECFETECAIPIMVNRGSIILPPTGRFMMPPALRLQAYSEEQPATGLTRCQSATPTRHSFLLFQFVTFRYCLRLFALANDFVLMYQECDLRNGNGWHAE